MEAFGSSLLAPATPAHSAPPSPAASYFHHDSKMTVGGFDIDSAKSFLTSKSSVNSFSSLGDIERPSLGSRDSVGSLRPLLGKRAASSNGAPAQDTISASKHAATEDSAMLPSTNHTLTAHERTAQVRRNQKLAKLLGEESIGTLSSSTQAPSRSAVDAADPGFLERRSNSYPLETGIDPAARFLAPKTFAERSEDTRGSISPTLSQRSSIDATLSRKRSISFSGTSLNLSPQGASHRPHSIYLSSFIAPSEQPVTLSTAYLRPDANPVNVKPKAAALLGLDPGSNHPVSTLPGERSPTLPKSLQKLHLRSQSFTVGNKGGHTPDHSGTPRQFNELSRTNNLSREERKRKVAKLSRWLGVVVPPEMIVSGQLQHDVEGITGFHSASGLRRMLRRDASDPQDTFAAIVNQEIGMSSDLSARERFASVRKASKLERVFGEKVPPPLLIASQRTPNRASTDSYLDLTSPDDDDSSARFETQSSGSAAYRHSLSSLGFLLDTDTDLLGDIIAILEDDEHSGEDAKSTLWPSAEGANSPSLLKDLNFSSGDPERSAVGLGLVGAPVLQSQQPATAPSTPQVHHFNQGADFFDDHHACAFTPTSASSDEEAQQESKRRAERARKAQRLSKFFGEAVPLQPSGSGRDRPTLYRKDSSRGSPSRRNPLHRTRVSFLKLLDSLESEAAEDSSLSDYDRHEIEQGAEILRARSAQAFASLN